MMTGHGLVWVQLCGTMLSIWDVDGTSKPGHKVPLDRLDVTDAVTSTQLRIFILPFLVSFRFVKFQSPPPHTSR